ncbi:Nitrogen assimilation transcription factor nit-4 like protein [Verticillium longisporum]|nr:Nitrogen assimilation transcription factor nit-4 like protein [Verticillium longisporum]
MARAPASSQPSDEKKRQRVSLACLTCRSKHIRCDGVQPVCGFCQRNSTECNFAHEENKRRPPSKKFVESLQARIRHLEEQLAAAESRAVAEIPFCDTINDSTDVQSDPTAPNEDGEDPLSNLTALVGRLNVADDGQLHYFGSQSSYNLLKKHADDVASLEPSLKMQRQGLAAAAQLDKLVAIPVELQQHLLELYWQWQNPWNYVIHKGAFMESFRGEDDGRHCSPLLLTAGDAFCDQAKILLLYESEAPTITTVQAACILALRIMSDGKEALGWLYAGNATRMAHNLGLHVDLSDWTSRTPMSPEEVEARKVTWWGCYVVDKLFALGLGRPSSTPKMSITCSKLRTDGDEEYTPWVPPYTSPAGLSSLGVHSRIPSNACHLSDTMTIACEAMDAIYAPNSKLSFQEMEAIITKADVELRSHYGALPSYLRLTASTQTPMMPHVCLYHVQYHAHLILLHRPLML